MYVSTCSLEVSYGKQATSNTSAVEPTSLSVDVSPNRRLRHRVRGRQDLPGFVFLVVYRYDYSDFCIDLERTPPASRALRTRAASSGVDDEAGVERQKW